MKSGSVFSFESEISVEKILRMISSICEIKIFTQCIIIMYKIEEQNKNYNLHFQY